MFNLHDTAAAALSDEAACDVSSAAGQGQQVVFHRPPRPRPPKPQRWSVAQIEELLALPFMDLLWRAQTVHRQHWPAGEVELATLLSVKTGGCPEN